MSLIIRLIEFALDKFGVAKSAVSNAPRPNMLYMKRIMFAAASILVLWALVDAESLATRLEMASEILPSWFTGLLLTVFSGVWL